MHGPIRMQDEKSPRSRLMTGHSATLCLLLPLLPSGPGGVHFRYSRRNPAINDGLGLSSRWFGPAVRFVKPGHGGEGGIRTRGGFRHTRFPVVHLRPLGHLSSSCPEACRFGFGTERGGFEPPVRRYRTTDFESAAFVHSATSPKSLTEVSALYPSVARFCFRWARRLRKKSRNNVLLSSPRTPRVTANR